MHSIIVKIFRNVAGVPKSCKLNIFLFSFFRFLFWLELCALKCCKCFNELNLFMGRRQGLHWNTKIYSTWYIQYKYAFLHKLQTNSVHPFLSDALCLNFKRYYGQNKNAGCINVKETVCTGRSIFFALEVTRRVYWMMNSSKL